MYLKKGVHHKLLFYHLVFHGFDARSVVKSVPPDARDLRSQKAQKSEHKGTLEKFPSGDIFFLGGGEARCDIKGCLFREKGTTGFVILSNLSSRLISTIFWQLQVARMVADNNCRHIPIEIVVQVGIHLLGVHQPYRLQLVGLHPVHASPWRKT